MSDKSRSMNILIDTLNEMDTFFTSNEFCEVARNKGYHKRLIQNGVASTIIMDVKNVFKKYPDNEPNYKGVHFLTITKYKDSFSYSITYYDDECEWRPKYGKVVAFVEISPSKVIDIL